ncbi:hypothetical protein RIF29_02083 [Crotalaria pallida]|uniref:Uncharacterized protein n=1 Tax=Crotalaria pallida TaxID=3830 RepID=A0AAN9P8G4_CROPI
MNHAPHCQRQASKWKHQIRIRDDAPASHLNIMPHFLAWRLDQLPEDCMKGLFIITERDKPKRKLPNDALRRVATPCHATLFAYIALEANAKPVPSRPKSTSKLSRLAPLSETTAQPVRLRHHLTPRPSTRSMYSPRTMPRHLVWFLDELPKDCIEGSMHHLTPRPSVRSGSHRQPRCIEDDAHDCLPCQHATRSTTQTREMIASCEAPRLPIGSKERSLDASALHPTCQTKSHRRARIFPSDQHAPGHVRPGFGSRDDSLESPPRHGKSLHTSMGWLEKALGEAPMAHHPDPAWCMGRQPASPPYNRLICQNAPCTSGYPFC